ncbi:helix-turn-helix domain-containing protein [Gracilibacillus xinjiangensis]|uniref:Helix-turn-helix domain-containing protein n=1 Tax=Gracilibacillus xinjiangensis TaxID=1193282 RepID=A0ABV8WY25_9BACI
MKTQHMTTKETAEYIGVHPDTLRKYVHQEHLPVLRFPGRRKWMFRKDLVDQWVEKRSEPQVYINDQLEKETENQEYGQIRVLQP